MTDRRLHRVALFLPKGHDYASRLIEGVLAAAKTLPHLQFIEIPYEEDRTPPDVYSLKVAGALVWTHAGCRWVLDLRDRGVTIVSCNTEWSTAGIPCVGVDLQASVERAIGHFRKLRRGHVAYVGHMTQNSPAKRRQRDAFVQLAQTQDWSTAVLDLTGIPSEERHRLAEPEREQGLITFLRHLPRPTAVFCDDDYVAALVCGVAAHLGLTVPADVAVLGYFDMTIARFSMPTISSLPGSGQAVGTTAIKLLADLLAGKPAPVGPVFVAAPPVAERESTGGSTERDDDMRKARDLIDRFACKGLTVDQLLSRLSLSQKTLNKRFRAVFGLTPGQAIRSVRADRARELLSSTDLSMGRIADMCGFDEQSNFNLFFRREVGCTPGQYRARSR